MSAAALSAGLFAGGVVVGVTGAYVLRRPPTEAHVNRPVEPIQTAEVRPPLPTASYDGRHLLGNHPGPIADFLRQVAFVSAYDRMHRHPHWTAEHITAAHLRAPEGERGDRSRSVFKEDDRIPDLFRSKNADYFRSGYDRGHMVPAADAKVSQTAMDQTFYLTNIAPQVGEGFNRDYWAHTEDFVRRLTQQFADLYVFTIPLYLPRQGADGKWRVSYEVIGNPPSVSVPTHFAKVIYGHGKPGTTAPPPLPAPTPPPPMIGGAQSTSDSASGPAPTQTSGLLSSVGLGKSASSWTALGAFVMPNAIIPNDAPLASFAVPVEAVERAAGLLLFSPAIKANTRALCDVIDCKLIVRDFSDRNKAGPPIRAAK